MQHMQPLMVFCEQCGAANPEYAEHCFEPEVSYPLSPGFLLANRYQIIEQIGAGGFGLVYKAKDTKNHQKLVTVKQINMDQLSTDEVIQVTDSYQREIMLQSRLWHEHIPYLYAHFTDPKNWYLVMEYIRGETLEEYLKRVPAGKLPPRTVLTIGIQLCDILRYLHREHNIIFRDVKPANIMRTHNGHLYLIDFGIARRYVRGKAKDTTPLGSPGYAAPEQYGTAQSNVRTDIYGLGATLLTLLNGIDPAEDTPTGGVPSLPPSPAISKKFQALLDQVMARDSDQRPMHMGIVKRKLLFVRDGILGRIALSVLTSFIGVMIGATPICCISGESPLCSQHSPSFP